MESQHVLTITDLTRQIKDVVEDSFPRVTVLGEISNLSRASSGHVYLTLKDQGAQIRAVIWRSAAARLKFELQDGLEVVATGAVEVYAQRGSYQLIIQQVLPQGVGALELAFRQMQEKLAAEGLFDPQHKRPLPRIPQRIAMITSPTGAAVRDMLQVITRRWPLADIVLLPVAVQGDQAAGQITQAIQTVPRIAGVDVVIVGRGGGSLEDLWPFNEEIVARAIHACPVPVISAVGHEIDVSIADFVADRRALTPSEAGELAVPSIDEIVGFLESVRGRFSTLLRDRLSVARARLEGLAGRRVLQRPEELIRERALAVDELATSMTRGMEQLLDQAQQQLRNLAGSLDALSPLRVLSRGYSVTCLSTGQVVSSIQQIEVGETLKTRVPDGVITSTATEIVPTN